MSARIVCGAANNQLEDPERDARALADARVVYVPDFLANRMGIVNCANEQYGSLDDDPAILDHLSRETPFGIHRRTLTVLEAAERSGRTPAEEAEELAETLSDEPHPIWGNRAQRIIDGLIRSGWERA
jgi:glutamate dehydrogenase/leucine dehydrogenase